MTPTAEATRRTRLGLNASFLAEPTLCLYRATFQLLMLLQSTKNVDVVDLKAGLKRAPFAQSIHNVE
jgi:hypothetical protein